MRVIYHKTFFWVCVFLLAAGYRCAAQGSGTHKPKGLRPPGHEKGQGIYLLADGRKDSVVLRWAPSTDVLWTMGNKYGYIVERFTAIRKGKIVPEGNRQPLLLTPEPLRPWSKQAMVRLVEKDDYAGVYEEALYEDDFNVRLRSEGPGDILAQNQQAQNRFGFAVLVCDFSPMVARAAALRLADKKPAADEKYIYRVRIALPDSLKKTIVYRAGVVMLAPGESFLRPSIRDLKAKFGDRAVALSWNQEMLHGLYTAYNIERSVEGGPFVKVNPQPFVQMTTQRGKDKYAYYVDSLPGNYIPCAYRISGISPFGDGAWSDTVKGTGVSKLDYRPLLDSVRLTASGSSAIIHWSLPDSIRKLVAGIYVSKAPKTQGPYTDLNAKPYAPGQVEATDPLVVTNSTYYRLRLVEKDGSQISGLPYYVRKEDSIPPAVPVGLQGKSDRKGIAVIQWQRSTEKDLKGYRLFRSQVKTGEYFEVTKGPTMDTVFRDTLNLSFTNPEVYYKVLALDRYYNSSDYSACVAVRRPDTIPPMPALITGLTRKDTVVWLSFIPGGSADVRSYQLYRRVKGDEKRELVAVYPAGGDVMCSDEPAATELGKTLIYEIEAMDSSGNSSWTHSGELFYETGFRAPVRSVLAEADREHRKIALSWRYDQPGVARFIVFRAVNGDSRFVSYASLPGTADHYEDADLHVSNLYKYKIMAVMKNGIESRLTPEVRVSY